ncbi:unnamed protein product [Notodromas monacha]|uniref:Uncharacterized protein n=1 Tax=Notodromas monacha TaxID=399045 RepID=A0A7R9C0Y3_9CRUS|nr:unnamed protein product [Notodromas monacha]CAG0925385.1 unnamed protein product [Notodromas monacha]
MPVLPTLAFTFAAFMALLNLTTIHAASEEEHETKKANWNCCLACQDAPQAIHPEPTVYPPECFTKCTYTVTKYTAAISKKCKCDPDKEAAAAKASRLEDDPPSLDPSESLQRNRKSRARKSTSRLR